MAKTLDFNTIKRPTLTLVMQDDDRTRIDVTVPTEGLVSELIATAPELEAVVKNGDSESIRAVYDLAARLISCNRNDMNVTGEELRDKYNLDLEAIIVFYGAYTDFINEIANAKN